LLFSDYRTDVPLPKPPAEFGHATLYKNWGMLGNDEWGDCVEAGSAHEVMEWSTLAGAPVAFTPQSVLSDYSASTGFNPAAGPSGNNPTDHGTNVQKYLEYRTATGILDASGGRHKLAAWVALTPGDWGMLLEAMWLFDAVGSGFQVPESAMEQFQAGQMWSYVGDRNIVGGHYVPKVGHPGVSLDADITWAQREVETRKFWEVYCDEVYALLSPEGLSKRTGLSAEHFDWDQLEADFKAL
jgi:hypothetical protein